MRTLISFFITWVAGALLAASAWAAPPLLTPAELQALRLTGSVRIIDTREGPAYALQHLPGSVSAPYGRWRGPATNPGQLPPMKQLAALVQELGLTPETHAVIVYTGVDSTDFGSAALQGPLGDEIKVIIEAEFFKK